MSDAGTTAGSVPARSAALFAIAVIAAAGLGYWAGASRDHTFEAVGNAYSTEEQIGIQTADWSYNVPVEVDWVDAEGTWHEGSRPECLPPSDENLTGIRFAAVPATVGDTSMRQVVAVFCD